VEVPTTGKLQWILPEDVPFANVAQANAYQESFLNTDLALFWDVPVLTSLDGARQCGGIVGECVIDVNAPENIEADCGASSRTNSSCQFDPLIRISVRVPGQSRRVLSIHRGCCVLRQLERALAFVFCKRFREDDEPWLQERGLHCDFVLPSPATSSMIKENVLK